MAIPEYKPRSEYIGAGNLATYSFDFKVDSLSQVIIQVTDASSDLIFRIRASDSSIFLTSAYFDPKNSGGTITLASNLAAGYFLTILLGQDTPVQTSEWRNKSDFTLRRLEQALDSLGIQNQRVNYLVQRAIRLSDILKDADSVQFDTTLPITTIDPMITNSVGKTIIIGTDNKSLALGYSFADIVASIEGIVTALTTQLVQDLISASGVGLPVGGLQYSHLEKLSATDGDATWTDAIAYDGISARFGSLQFTANGLKAVLDTIIQITYTLPQISASGSSNVLREKGNSVASITLTATVTKKSNDIATVRLYQGANLLSTQAAGPGNDSKNVVYSTPFSDNISFSSQVDDILFAGNGPSTVTSNTVTYSFVYPYYYGAGAAAFTGAQVRSNLTLHVTSNTNNYSITLVSAGAQKLYIAYPASYGALTSILDSNLFEVISTFTMTTANITGLDASSVSYRIYESNNLVIAGSYAFQFKK